MTTDFVKVIANVINTHALLPLGAKVIVALSGGADSVALLSILSELGYKCIAAHCNFHLRGEESMRDQRHCEDICRKLGVELLIKDFDVELHRQQTKESVEMACRSLRYEWFDQLLSTTKAEAVAVGHHREDKVETMLLNLFRGTGIEGLRGMRYRRDNIIRPLLDSSRQEIEEYLRDKNLTYIVDSSNLATDYLRNRIRLAVIPEIEKNFPKAINGIMSTMSILDSEAELIDRSVDESTDITPTLLYRRLKPYGINPSQAKNIVDSADGSGLKFKGKHQFSAELDRGTLRIIEEREERTDDNRPVNFSLTIHDIAEFKPLRDPSTIYLDASVLCGEHRWTLRPWQKGDRIKAFGLKGSKLVSDIFTDAKLPSADKRRVRLLCCDGEIVWVVGLRSSRLFAVTPSTKKFIKLKITT